MQEGRFGIRPASGGAVRMLSYWLSHDTAGGRADQDVAVSYTGA